ncbi:hypothetical protein [Aeromonas media]|uniref:hypothetical protein n=1 Tax=Aeromonas media TaxID=651 RepID=UPI003D033BFA
MGFKEYLQIFAICISLIALFFVVRNYWRKSGTYVRGQYSVPSSAWAEEQYVSSLTIENVKDRPVIIFKVFLLVGRKYYILLNDYEHDPKILKPYECFTCHYDPVDFYSVSMNRIKMNKLLDSRQAPARIVLATSNGKYVIKEWIKRWDPIVDFFNNHMTAIIHPMRPNSKQGFYGADVKYLVNITTEDGYKKTTPIFKEDYNFPRFKEFRLTEESLSSKEKLDEFLTEQAINGKLKCIDVEVLDAEKLRKENYGSGYNKTFEAEHIGWFEYKVLGKLLTKESDVRLYFVNRKARKANKALQRTSH